MHTSLKTVFRIIVILSGTALLFVYTHLPYTANVPAPETVLRDAGHIDTSMAYQRIAVKNIEDIQNGIKDAGQKNLKVSISGKRHTMGGHTQYPNSMHLDMSSYNKVLSFDPETEIVTVQSGTTWAMLQEYLNPLGYSLIAMQGPNIFTVGGSMSVNAHGWDLRTPTVADTIAWFTLVQTDGSIIRCSEEEHTELFHAVLGGYGLFGVIADVGIYVTPNTRLIPAYDIISYQEFPEYFSKLLERTPAPSLFYGDLSIAPESFLKEMVVSSFTPEDNNVKGHSEALEAETNIYRDRFFIQLSRRYAFGRSLRWYLYKTVQLSQRVLTRNNLMRANFERLHYYAAEDVDILQEYFIPRNHFVSFIDDLRSVVTEYNANLINVTIRSINASSQSLLNYARQDAIAVVLYFNVKRSAAGMKKDAAMTQRLIDAALSYHGTFYLPYLSHYTAEQVQQAYPESETFFSLKRHYDPDERFYNLFYHRYGRITLNDQSVTIRTARE